MIRTAHIVCVLSLLLSFAARLSGQAPAVDYRVSWFGNTFYGGPSLKWVPNEVDGMIVAPDGTVYTNSYYDENGREASMFKNGDIPAIFATTGRRGLFEGTHGFARNGGAALAFDATYVYIGVYQGYNSSTATQAGYPPLAGQEYFTIRRYDKSGNPAPFVSKTNYNGSAGYDGSMLVINKTLPVAGSSPAAYTSIGADILAIAVNNGRLYVLDRHSDFNGSVETISNKIRVFLTSTLAEQTAEAITLPGLTLYTNMTVNPADGTLWLCGTADGLNDGTGPQILHVNPVVGASGTTAVVPVSPLYDPMAVAFDNAGNLMIADNGAHQQILFYNVSTATPQLVRTYGQPGGILGGPAPGVAGSDRFEELTGVGMDAAGNLLVSYTGNGKRIVYPQARDPRSQFKAFLPGGRNQFHLRSYAPAATSFTLTSEAESHAFVNNADVDPASESDLYLENSHYQFNYAASDPLTPNWTFVGSTINHNLYPNDPRMWHNNGVDLVNPTMRRINGKLFMYLMEAHPAQIFVYRFDGETAIPSAAVSYETTQTLLPPLQPSLAGVKMYPWTWYDANGDGNFQASEYTLTPNYSNYCGGCGHMTAQDIDPNGDIWTAITAKTLAGFSIFHFRLHNIDANGSPVFDTWAQTEQFALPARSTPDPTPQPAPIPPVSGCVPPPPCGLDLCGVYRLAYRGGVTDTMYLMGFTGTDQAYYCGNILAESAGATIIRYDNWSNLKTRTTVWKKSLLYNIPVTQYADNPTSLSVAGNRVFISYSFAAHLPTTPPDNPASSGGDTLILNAADGSTIETMARGYDPAQVGLLPGDLLDFPQSAKVFLRSNGQYVILQEEDTQAKITAMMSPITADRPQVPTQTSLTGTPGSGLAGSTFTFNAATATLTAGYGSATGSTTFLDGAVALGNVPVDANGIATFTTASLAAGTHQISAQYNQDPSHLSSTSSSFQIVVYPPAVATQTAVTASPASSALGTSVVVTATVSSAANGAPSGAVTIFDGTQTISTGTLNSSGSYTVTTASFALGQHNLTAQYGGDQTHNTSTSAVFVVTIVPPAAATQTTISSSAPVVAVGTNVAFTGSVTATANGLATGTVTVLDGTTPIGSVTLSGGTYSLSTTTLAAGTHMISATYAGDSGHVGSASGSLVETVGNPAYTLTVTPGTATLGANSRATVQIVLATTFGFKQPISLSNSALPAYASARFSPVTVTPDGMNTPVSVSFTIVDDNKVAASDIPPAPGQDARPGAFAALVLGFLLLGVSGRSRGLRCRLKGLVARAGVSILLLALASLSGGCGSGGNFSSSQTSSQTTPKGTYSITLTGTSNQTVVSTPFILTVQ